MPLTLLERLFSLKDKTVLITGGYKGIGLLFAETYAEAGASVVLAARNEAGCRRAAAGIAKQFGVKAFGVAMDVHDTGQVHDGVRKVMEICGAVDVLVNCAGVPGSEKPVLEMSDEDLDDVMNVDFRGTFLVSRAVARFMAERKSGRIINVSSILGKISARNMAGYCAGKAAVLQLTRVMALELMRDHIQVNALCPGYFLTDFNREFFESEAGLRFVKKMIPLQRVGRLEELQSSALYLATAPAFLTGVELCIDGGHTLV